MKIPCSCPKGGLIEYLDSITTCPLCDGTEWVDCPHKAVLGRPDGTHACGNCGILLSCTERKCTECDDGKVDAGTEEWPHLIPCPECDGRGYHEDFTPITT